MAKLSDYWNDVFNGSFETEEDVIDFIFDRLNTSDFEDSYVDTSGNGEPNEMFKITAQDKRNALYTFMME